MARRVGFDVLSTQRPDPGAFEGQAAWRSATWPSSACAQHGWGWALRRLGVYAAVVAAVDEYVLPRLSTYCVLCDVCVQPLFWSLCAGRASS
jgi:hypothetical protein